MCWYADGITEFCAPLWIHWEKPQLSYWGAFIAIRAGYRRMRTPTEHLGQVGSLMTANGVGAQRELPNGPDLNCLALNKQISCTCNSLEVLSLIRPIRPR